MTMFEWRDDYKIGNPTIDSQHKRLFELAERFHTAMAQGKGISELGHMLDDLVSYTKLHFATEERIMQQSEYPEYADHKRKHDGLTAKVVDFQKTFAHASATGTMQVMQFLKDWLQHHIGGTDRKIGEYLSARG